MCGDLSLKKRIRQLNPKLVCFGHIHNMTGVINQGYVRFADHNTIYSNGSVVTDGKFGQINNNGNIFELSK
jgi:Icc-related predicted phosphoesterase